MRITTILACLFVSPLLMADDYSHRYFDYSGSDGCMPPNIGHGLGGDLPEFEFNTLEGMLGIESMQDSRCFKNWELDINQSHDSIIVAHDTELKGISLVQIRSDDLSEKISTLSEFAKSFASIKVIKPVILDIKNVPDRKYWPELIETALSIKRSHNVEVWFIISPQVAKSHKGLCEFVDGRLDIMLYRKAGPLCIIQSAEIRSDHK